MSLSVNTILSFFRLMAHLLEKRATAAAKKLSDTNEQINALIVAREGHATENSRAQAAAKKLREFTI